MSKPTMAPLPVRICFAGLRWAPVIFITAVIVWSYYAYVIQMCLFTVQSIPEKVIYLLVYHPILFLFAWSYWMTIFTEPGSPPKEFYLGKTDLERFDNEECEESQRDILARVGRNLPVQCRTATGAIRFCEKCKCIKPDRAHHCSVCGQCVLKMDHHCPWVNNCVSFVNYKFFVLFLGYAFIYCIYVALTSLQYFIMFWTATGSKDMGKFHILFLFFAAVMFAISLISLFGYHCYLVSVNRSTLESFRAPIFRSGPDKDGFSMGRYGNFIEVFGEQKKFWFLPMHSRSGDGVSFPTRVVPIPSSYNSMESTVATPVSQNPPAPNSNTNNVGDGVNYPIRTVDEDFDSLLGQRQRWMEEGGDEHIPVGTYGSNGSKTSINGATPT